MPTARTAGDGRARRAGRWWAAAVLAGAALSLGAGPALAGGAGEVVQPRTSNPVTFGSETYFLHFLSGDYSGPMKMTVVAPEGMVLTDGQLAPVGDAPGGWACNQYKRHPGGLPNTAVTGDGDVMHCTASSTVGVITPPFGGWRWQVNLAAAPDAPPNPTPAPFFAHFRHSWNGVLQSRLYMSLGTGTARS